MLILIFIVLILIAIAVIFGRKEAKGFIFWMGITVLSIFGFFVVMGLIIQLSMVLS